MALFGKWRRLPTLGQWGTSQENVSCGLMLCSGDALFSRLIQAASRSSISHVGCLVCDPKGNWQVLESTTMRKGSKGVQMNPLEDIVGEERGTVWVRPLVLPLGPDVIWDDSGGQRLARRERAWLVAEAVYDAWGGRPYEQNLLELVRSVIDLGIPQVGDNGSLFCSELAAHWLAALGLLDLERKSAAEFTPADFGQRGSRVRWLQSQPRHLLRC